MKAALCTKFLCVAAVLMASTLMAQTLATGDSRTVTEPAFPPVCTTLSAQMTIVSGAPASETTFDTSRIQTALTGCAAGKAVELTASGSNNAFLTAPINIPSGVGLIVDGGVTVFASRNREDFQVSPVSSKVDECGGLGAHGNGCKPFISFANGGANTGSGIYGYGVIDARGGSTTFKAGVDSGISYWMNSDNLPSGKVQNNPYLMNALQSTNFTLYKITLKNAAEFHVKWAGSGLTAWGVKIISPFPPHNTAGFVTYGTNQTITQSSISDGDDQVSIVGGDIPAANVTVSDTNTYSGHGISVGSPTEGGVTNFLVKNVNIAGTASEYGGVGLRLKSSENEGGLVQTVTFENMCVKDMRDILYFNPFYNTSTGTEIPSFQNIVLQNVHFLAASSGASPYVVRLQGHDATHISTITFNNVVFDALASYQISNTEYGTFTLQGNVYPAFLHSITGTGISYNGSATAIAGSGVSSCVNAFPYIVGDLYLGTATATNLQTATIASGNSVALNAVIQTAMSQLSDSESTGTWVGAAALTKSVNFYEGATLVGSSAISGNGTLASLALSGLTEGTHTYTAQYPGDSNYSALTFGSVTVTVPVTTVATTTSLAAPSSAAYGSPVALSATVTSASGTPTGTVTFYDGASVLQTQTLASGSASITGIKLAGGSHTLTAAYAQSGTYLASTSTTSNLNVTTAGTTTALSATPSPVTVNTSATLTATVTGVSGMATPTGTVVFTDGATNLGPATLNSGTATLSTSLATIGSRTITAAYGGDSNYTASSGTTGETVSAIGTTLTLGLSVSATYPGAAVTLTATLSPAQPGATISFLSGTNALGAAQTNSFGVATYSLTPSATGTYSLSAAFAAAGNYGASTSTTQSLTVGSAVSLSAPPGPLTIAPGQSGTLNVTIAPVAGYAGPATLACSSGVSYVTCSPANSTVTLGTTAVSVTESVSVAATVTSVQGRMHGAMSFAVLLPIGILGWAGFAKRRKILFGIALVFFLAAASIGMTGCGSASQSAKAAVPSGSQTITLTVTAAGVSQAAAVVIHIQ